MDHAQVQKRLQEFQDEELSEQERRLVSEHLEICQDCRDQLKRWNETQQVLSGLLAVSDSEAFLRGVMSKIEAFPAHQTGIRRRWVAPWVFRIPEWLYPEVGLAAAAAVLFAAGFFQQPPAVSTEALILSRMQDDIRWVGLPPSSKRSGLDFLWEEG